MANTRTEILVSVRDKASAALRGIGKKLGAFAKPQTPGSHCDEFVVTAAFPSIFLYIKYI